MTGNDRSGGALPDLSEEPIRVIASYVEETAIYGAVCALAITAGLVPSWAQSAEPARRGTLSSLLSKL
jgi:hypothetical protein